MGRRDREEHPICEEMSGCIMTAKGVLLQAIINVGIRAHAIYEEVMLIHVYLHARSPAIEVE